MGCCCIKRSEELDDSQEDLLSSKVKLAAEQLKQQGNKNFKKRLYQNAIKCYKQALLKNSKEIVYYTNLALAYKSNKQYKQSIETIDRLLKYPALILRPDGQTLIKKGKITKCRSALLLAKQYILQQKYSNSLTQNILKILDQTISLLVQLNKTEQFQKQTEQYLKNANKIKKYMINLTKSIKEEEQLRTYFKKKLNVAQTFNSKKHEQKWSKVNNYFQSPKHILDQLDRLIKIQRSTQFQQNEEEQYILDPITYETFQSPVIVPSGLTYDQQILRQHFSKNGHKDPITKQQYKAGQKIIVRNKNLQKYILGTNQQNIRKEQIQLMIC